MKNRRITNRFEIRFAADGTVTIREYFDANGFIRGARSYFGLLIGRNRSGIDIKLSVWPKRGPAGLRGQMLRFDVASRRLLPAGKLTRFVQHLIG